MGNHYWRLVVPLSLTRSANIWPESRWIAPSLSTSTHLVLLLGLLQVITCLVIRLIYFFLILKTICKRGCHIVVDGSPAEVRKVGNIYVLLSCGRALLHTFIQAYISFFNRGYVNYRIAEYFGELVTLLHLANNI